MPSCTPSAVIVLAAGQGTRMRSQTAKVLHSIGGRSLLEHAVNTAMGVEATRVCVVVRHQKEEVVAHLQSLEIANLVIAEQDDIPGTGRAVQCGLQALQASGKLDGPVIVTSADVPLTSPRTLLELLAVHQKTRAAVSMLTTKLPNPAGYGRVVRENGQVQAVVEQQDATEAQQEITEINGGIYVFDADYLTETLPGLGQNNAQGEVYLTDTVAAARLAGRPVGALITADTWQVAGCNDRVQLSQLGAELNRRICEEWMVAGVTIVDPATTWIDVDVSLEADVTILPGVQLYGHCKIEAGAVIGPDTTLTHVSVGAGATVTRVHGQRSEIGPQATVGPFSYLRPGTKVGAEAKIGGFCETKNVVLGQGAKVPHLSYVGDATIGEYTNIGAATIFANYDGVNKHHTEVGAHCRTGSNNVFVAPVNIADGVYTGAGTIVRQDLPAGSLSINQVEQRVIEGWVERKRPGSAAAEAAKKSREQEL